MAEIHRAAMTSGAQVNTVQLVAGGKHRCTVVNVADDSTTVSSAPALLYGVFVNTALSAHACLIANASTTQITLAASLAAGTNYWWDRGVPFDTSLIVDPDNSGAGSITLVWAPQ
jgi:hypothetical protein